MVKIADDIIRDQQAERKVQNKKQKWHDEYATLKFFRYICRNVGNLQEGEIQRLIWQLKQSDKKAVEGNETGRISEHGEIRYREVTGNHQGYPGA